MAGRRVLLAILIPAVLPAPLISACSQDTEREALRAALEAERERNRELEAEVTRLRARLEGFPRSDLPEPAGEAAPEAEAGPEEQDVEAEEAEPPEGKPWFDGDSLLAGGLPPHEVERLREIFDVSEMDVIRLQNQATREGWFHSGRYWEALRDLRRGLREEIGDEAFDLLLFATGRSNRVVIREVLRGSPGERAGLEPGDVVLSYDDRRVFRPRELREATTQGDPGELVPLDVMHEGEPRRYYIPRGPIGVKMDSLHRMPATP